MHLMGTHGTSRTRAESIVASQTFNPTNEGWVTRGVYFWAFESSIGYAEQTAKLWWAFANKNSIYAGDADASCAVLKVKILRPEDGYFDATDQVFIEQFFEIAKEKNVHEDNLKETLAWYIDQTSQALQKTFSVIKASVPSPPVIKGAGGRQLSQLISKMSSVYVVKEHGRHLIEEIIIV